MIEKIHSTRKAETQLAVLMSSGLITCRVGLFTNEGLVY